MGAGTSASGINATAISRFAVASGNNTAAIGFNAQATGGSSTAVGGGAIASSGNATAVGRFASSTGPQSSAVGYEANAGGQQSTAVGSEANATGLGSTAIGNTATAAFTNSTAIGALATTTAANQVTIGGTGSSVRIGDVAASTAAQVGPVQAVTVDASGTLGTTAVASMAAVQDIRVGLDYIAAITDAQFDALTGRVSSLENGLAQTNFRLEEMDKGLSGGIAAAMALGSAVMVPDKAFSIAINAATYGGEQGFSGVLAGRVSDAMVVTAGVTGNTGDDRWGGQVGVAFGF
ncbi:hypothetical protein LY632_04745 [Erythrobacter sp. SDW2]|nr:hypothetical protein LY632_04745 [Erythrobacter sp. SDW2]